MRFWIAALTVPFLSTANAAECELAKASEMLTLPLPEKADQELEVSEQQSVEGGSWTIFNGEGKPQRIFRTDYGETGRTEHALALADANAFVIRKTYFRYSAPIYETGSTTVREETDYFRFCGGKLDLPENWEADETYLRSAQEAAEQFFTAPEIQPALNAAGLKPPLWK